MRTAYGFKTEYDAAGGERSNLRYGYVTTARA